MAVLLSEIKHQAEQMDANVRAQLAESLLASLNTPIAEVEEAWAEEIEARIAAFDGGKMKAVSAEQVFAEACSLPH